MLVCIIRAKEIKNL